MSQNVQTVNPNGSSSVVLVCEHAARYIPPTFQNLGLSVEASNSHAAWDPGAMAVAQRMSENLDAVLIAAKVSRLVYDCNRPPNAPDAMPAQSEVFGIPGNKGLSPQDKAQREHTFYEPFRRALADTIEQTNISVVVTIHSFTPVYYGNQRPVEIGILHDTDTRLADAMLDCATQHTQSDVQRNQPYGPEHGVTHTLKEHAIPRGHLNVMLEIRNDLIQTEKEQIEMADMISAWVVEAFSELDTKGAVQCLA